MGTPRNGTAPPDRAGNTSRNRAKQAGQPGLIPGSMATPGYLVAGRGVEESLCSASHGAGRAMSRQKAKESFTQSAMKKFLSQAGVTLIGGSIEEMPLAYKNIDRVMQPQETLVEVQGKFMPRIIRMNKLPKRYQWPNAVCSVWGWKPI